MNQSLETPQIALAYVGSVVPDQPAVHSIAFSRAGNMFQENLLAALSEAGLPPDLILSQQPLRAFPNSPVLWKPRSQCRLTSGLEVHLVPFLNLPFLRPLTVGLAVIFELIKWGWLLRKLPCKVIYTFNLTEPPGFFTFLAAKFIRAKLIASINDINIPGETIPPTLSRKIDYWLQKKLIPQIDGLVVVSQKIIQDFAPGKPFVRIEGGVNPSVIQHFSQQARPFQPEAPFTIVATGSLDEANGFREILAAMAFLPGHYRLRIAGAGPLQTLVQQQAARDSRIEYLGYLSFDQVLALYDSADVLINMRLTQRMHTEYFFPSKMMEYLASGVPVITTCTGHVEEEYADFVFLLRDETPEALAQLIEQVAQLPLAIRLEKGRAAQAYIQVHNTWQAQGEKLADFIRTRLLNSKK